MRRGRHRASRAIRREGRTRGAARKHHADREKAAKRSADPHRPGQDADRGGCRHRNADQAGVPFAHREADGGRDRRRNDRGERSAEKPGHHENHAAKVDQKPAARVEGGEHQDDRDAAHRQAERGAAKRRAEARPRRLDPAQQIGERDQDQQVAGYVADEMEQHCHPGSAVRPVLALMGRCRPSVRQRSNARGWPPKDARQHRFCLARSTATKG